MPLPVDLLLTILNNPNDDVPRLIASDWLEEQGEAERAELIRVQCELACLSGANCGGYYCDEQVGHIDCADPFGVKAGELRRRERALWKSLRESFDVCGIECRMGWESGIDQEDRIAIVRRGFVDEVRCTLADWVGSLCPACTVQGRGYGLRLPQGGFPGERCPDCRGAGRLAAQGPAIVACQPVTGVVVTDRVPYHNSSGCWLWNRGNTPPYGLGIEHSLPDGVFLLMADDIDFRNRNEWRTYRTRKAALDALSAACVRWARGRAG